MDTYQAIYDAVRSKVSTFNGYELVEGIRQQFDISHAVESVRYEFVNAAMAQQAPSFLFKPALSIDGNKWCALYGTNLQDGVAGFGDSPGEAMADFDVNWYTALITEGR